MSKKWIDFDFDTVETENTFEAVKNINPVPVKKSKNTKNAPGSITKKTTSISSSVDLHNKNSEVDFFKDLEPQCIEDLAVHNKKVAEVGEWLQKYTATNNHTSNILLLTGPTGCGKTITLKVLCKQTVTELNEWTNPVDMDFEHYRKQTDQFREFLFESKYASLIAKNSKKVTLVKDLPNIFIREPKEFHNILEQYFLGSNGPVIFICTDMASSNINVKDKLFTDDIKKRYPIDIVSFNPTSSTLLKTALKRAEAFIKTNLESFKLPVEHIIDSIIVSCSGDLRCALNQYYFASLLGTSNLPTEAIFNEAQSIKRKRGKQKNANQIKQMAKDETLGLFHSIGRVLNPKWLEDSREPRLNCDVNQLIDEFITYPFNTLGFLQENYLKHFGHVHDVSAAADILSFAQILVEKWHQSYTDNISEGLWIAVLGLLLANKHKVTAWNPIRGPRKIRQSFRKRETSSVYNALQVDSYYINLISKSNKPSIFTCLNE